MKKNMKKMLILLAATVLLLTFAVGGTIAYLVTSDGPVVNTFEPAEVTIKVRETITGNTKTNVYIENTGSAKAYIRAAIVVTWQDASGNVYPALPVQRTDYTISLGSDWTEQDGYYYYNGEVDCVAGSNTTTNLINSIAPVEGCIPYGYDLHVEILAQAIQAQGGAVTSATNWTITDPTAN